jgi:hypothetical protein
MKKKLLVVLGTALLMVVNVVLANPISGLGGGI